MAFFSLRGFLGYGEEIEDDQIRTNLRKRISQYCKPCWELKYCPYGPIVEDYPLPDPVLKESIEHHNYLKRCLKTGRLSGGKKLDATRRKFFEMMVEDFDSSKCVERNDDLEEFMRCKIFGHFCPVYFTAEEATETADARKRSRSIDRATMFRVARRDRYVCRRCGENVEDEDVEFDHVISFSLGGDSDEDNIQLTNHRCNQTKKAKLDPDFFSKDPVGRLMDSVGAVDEERGLEDLKQLNEARDRRNKVASSGKITSST